MNTNVMSILMLVLIVAVMYFLMIRPQKKKQKEVDHMRNNLSVGDEIVTIGGIKGKIVKTKDETIVIQVGADRIKFEMMRWSISSVVAPSNRADEAEEQEEPKKVARPKRMVKPETEAPETVEAPEADDKVEDSSEDKAE